MHRIACTLSPSDMPKRAADIRALGRDALLGVERRERRALLRFRPDPAVRARLEEIVAAESKCCAFLDFDLAAGDDALELTLAAPAGGEPALYELADMFGPALSRAEAGWSPRSGSS
jgi:hypothetical protein